MLELEVPYNLKSGRTEETLHLVNIYPMKIYLEPVLDHLLGDANSYVDYVVEEPRNDGTIIRLIGSGGSLDRLHIPLRVGREYAEKLLQKESREKMLRGMYVLEVSIDIGNSRADIEFVGERREPVFPYHASLRLPHGSFYNTGNVIHTKNGPPFGAVYSAAEWIDRDDVLDREDVMLQNLAIIDGSRFRESRLTLHRGILEVAHHDQERVDRTDLDDEMGKTDGSFVNAEIASAIRQMDAKLVAKIEKRYRQRDPERY